MIQYGQFITDIVTFVIVGLVMFFIARWAMKLFAGLETEKGPSAEDLLTEIRDTLQKK